MRESFTATRRGVEKTRVAEPTSGAHVGSAMQSRSGVLPGCCCAVNAGTAYGCTPTGRTASDSASGALSMALVFDTAHTHSSLDCPSSKKTASELSRNSVPPLSVAYCEPGEIAGHTVNAGAGMAGSPPFHITT